MPKWELLREVVEEIQEERRALLASGDGSGSGGSGPSDGRAAAAAAAPAGSGGWQADVVVLDGSDEEGPGQGAADGTAAGSADGDMARAAAAAPVLVVCQDTFTAGQVGARLWIRPNSLGAHHFKTQRSLVAGMPTHQEPSMLAESRHFCLLQLREVLKSGGPGALMQRLYSDYLQYKLDGGSTARRRGAAAAGQADAPAGAGEAPPSGRMMGGYRPGEETALLKEAKALRGRGTAASGSSGRCG
jgi:hypothetical protein